MAEDWRCLNLGCGNQTYGTHRVDVVPTESTTHVFDVEKGVAFPDEYFDEVFERNLLEHLRNVGSHLDECYRVLKKGGKLTLITDYAGCTRYYALGTHEGRYEKKHKDNPRDRHFSIFTVSHLRNHLEFAGFRIQEVELFETDTAGRWIDKIMRRKARIRAIATK